MLQLREDKCLLMILRDVHAKDPHCAHKTSVSVHSMQSIHVNGTLHVHVLLLERSVDRKSSNWRSARQRWKEKRKMQAMTQSPPCRALHKHLKQEERK